MSGRLLSTRLSAALGAQRSFHLSASEGPRGARGFHYEILFADNDGEGTFTSQSANIQLHILSIGSDLFVSASDAQWRRSFKYRNNASAKLAAVSGKYLVVRANSSNLTAAGLADIASWANRDTLINMLCGINAIGATTFTDQGTTALAGQRVTRYDAPGSGTDPGFELDVAATGPPLPVRLATLPSSSLAATIDFTNYGTPASVSRPPASQIVQQSVIYPDPKP